MLIISKFPKSIAGCTKCPRGLRVWDPCHRQFSNNNILSRYLFVTIKTALQRFNHNHVEHYRFHQWFHINFTSRKKAWVK